MGFWKRGVVVQERTQHSKKNGGRDARLVNRKKPWIPLCAKSHQAMRAHANPPTSTRASGRWRTLHKIIEHAKWKVEE